MFKPIGVTPGSVYVLLRIHDGFATHERLIWWHSRAVNAEPKPGFFLRTSFRVQLRQKSSAKLGPLPLLAPIFDERTHLIYVTVKSAMRDYRLESRGGQSDRSSRVSI